MNNTIENGTKGKSLIERISGELAEDIRRGILPPGAKLPGERKLSARFHASRGTVTEALNLLARKNLIERIPQSGSYVMKQYRRFALVFPGDYASPPYLSALENWQIVSEIFRGALQEAVNNDAEAVLVCFEDDADKVKLQNQLRRLRSFDAVFILAYYQLSGLRAALQKEKIPFTRLVDIRDDVSDREILSRPDTEFNFHLMCRKIREKGYQNVILMTTRQSNDSKEKKLALFHQIAMKNGLSVENIFESSDLSAFLKTLQAGKDVVYCENTEFVPTVYKAAAECSLVPGKSFGLIGYASGLTFLNLAPALTYLKINHHHIGSYAIRKLNEILDGKDPEPHYVTGSFMEGETL